MTNRNRATRNRGKKAGLKQGVSKANNPDGQSVKTTAVPQGTQPAALASPEKIAWNRTMDELQNARMQAEALCELFLQKLIHPDGGDTYTQRLQCGFIELKSSTFRRLFAAEDAVRCFHYATSED